MSASTLTPQQRRTRQAILDAAGRLLSAGATPSVGDVATEAEVSRRTVYLHFASLEHLLADAALGEASRGVVDGPLDALPADADVPDRVEAVVRAVQVNAQETEHLGRVIMRSSVPDGGVDGAPPRGYRRVRWIETALEPVREQLGPGRLELLVSALTTTLGWEPSIVLRDVRGLRGEAAVQVSVWAARALVAAALADSYNPG